MTDPDPPRPPQRGNPPGTRFPGAFWHAMRGRDRIVRTAAELVAERGTGGTTLEDVGAATGASQAQLHRYFGDDRGLVEAVVDHQCASVVGWQARVLASVNDWDGLERWADEIVAAHGFRPNSAPTPRGAAHVGTET